MSSEIELKNDGWAGGTSAYNWMNLEVDDNRVGKARVHASGRTLSIDSIQVFPEFQRKGYARKVIDSLKKKHNELVADRVRCGAREFWTKMGFHPEHDGNYVWKGSSR